MSWATSGLLYLLLATSTLASNTPWPGSIHARHLQARDTTYCKKHTVKSGDTCQSLAKACGITLNQFYDYNSESICPKLQAEQKVCCSSGSLKPQPYANGTCYTYKTKDGDNCYDLSVAWSVTQDEIADFNDGTTWGWSGCDNLGIDMHICLSKGNAPMPASISNAVCGPQVPGTTVDGSIKDASDLAKLNPCPLNSCCNIWGHCGIDASFCTESKGPTGNPGTSKKGVFGCISNCGTDIVNNDKGPSNGYQRVGYYETFNWDRNCLHMRAEWSNTLNYTHMHWAFASVGEDLSIYIDDSHDQWKGFMKLKDVKRIASFGGWGFSTETATYEILRKAMEPANRDKFVSNMVAFAERTGIDGIDIDWEYPGAPDIPGIPPGLKSDGPNYLATLKALRKALPDKYTLSIAAPASYWYLKAFPIAEMSKVIDYIVFMAYDLHGQWDYGNENGQSGCPNGDCLRSHVNATEVHLALSMITKAGVQSNKIMVGESSYGRAFKMAEAGCTGPMCHYTGTSSESDAKPGRCTNTGGYLSDAEIKEIISRGNGTVKTWHDKDTASDYLVYDDLEWVAYMDSDTKQARRDTWEGLNFAGTIDWAVDLQEFNAADTVGESGDYDKDTCINVFDDMIWDWVNPAIEAPVSCTNLIQASPLPTTVTRTAYTTLTLVSGASMSTTVASTAFPISEVNFQPFTLASTDTESGTVITYRPIPRVTPSPMRVTVPQGWTVTSPNGKVDGPSTTTSLIGLPSSKATATNTAPSTDDDDGFVMYITWAPTISYNLPTYVTPKVQAPTIIPDDDSSPIPTPKPGVTDCTGDTCTKGMDCTDDTCTRGGDCTGPKCKRGGECTGPKCIRGGQCSGEECVSGGDCEGKSCVSGGGCSGRNCHKGGNCSGRHCSGGGGCVNTLLKKCSLGNCIGRGCSIDSHCPGCDNKIIVTVKPAGGSGGSKPGPKPECLNGCPTLPPCPGGDTSCNEACNAKACPPNRMPTGKSCTTLATANACTIIVSPTAVQTSPTTSYSTTTRTQCAKTMDCDVQDTTTTTTISTSETPAAQVTGKGIYDYWDDSKPNKSVLDSIAADFSEWERTADATVTKTSTTSKASTTTTEAPKPTISANGCDPMNGVQGVCWSKCDPDTSKPVNGDWSDDDPWCWLKDDDMGAFCNKVGDCPSNLECQPSDWAHGGCGKSKQGASGGCAPMSGTQGVCWSKCDPDTSDRVSSEWEDGDPWCWLMDDDMGAFCNKAGDCSSSLKCQPSSWAKGGCST
ncbi:hypothetical protein BDV25DRAFT_137130 [Aspergillus avenaceus]|uniref:chitinase n=1 Tax=Aspergillus avenaceus TaxID=36643 RepID=A0A5N6U3M7_ASPAV|nr:hypothetical protein BDV25DRAFT_137130 [Aspergillus avenaceus]